MTRVFFLAYVLVLVVGLAIIDARVGATSVARQLISVPGLPWTVGLRAIDPAQIAYVATRDFAPNHRLREADLRRNPRLPAAVPVPSMARERLVGKYAKRKIGAGTRVTDDDVQSRPAIAASPGKAAVVVGLRTQDPLADLIDPDWTGDLCHSRQCVVRGARLLAVLCAQPSTPCSVVVEVPEVGVRLVATDDPQNPIRFVPRTILP